MSDAVTPRSLVDGMPPELRPMVARLLNRLAHDLNTPTSTLTMELFSARMLLDKLRPSARKGENPDSARALLDLAEICSNLDHALSGLTKHVSMLSGLASDSAEPEGAGAALPPPGEVPKSKASP